MSITLNELQAWSERLPEQTSEEAAMLRAMISRREAELRLRIADLIAAISERENWKLQKCAATARRVEQTPVDLLEAVCQYFQDRNDGLPRFEAADDIVESLTKTCPADAVKAPAVSASATTTATATAAATVSLPPSASSQSVVELYSRMRALESMVTSTPGYGCGLQGIRIMRMVALMSKARSARLAQMRISGTQMIYRHA